jgi:hypothetical protein
MNNWILEIKVKKMYPKIFSIIAMFFLISCSAKIEKDYIYSEKRVINIYFQMYQEKLLTRDDLIKELNRYIRKMPVK